MNLRTLVRRAAVGVVAAATILATTPAAFAAPSATSGLYGSSDATYDGVYRQSLAITGLAVNGFRPAPAAIGWLLAQQCPDGSFQAYRPDLGKPCSASDPVNFTGPDTNSTATALMALMALDTTNTASRAQMDDVVDAADKAGRWLRKQQNRDGGWPYIAGGASDANSTGLALTALWTQLPYPGPASFKQGRRYLGSLSLACPAGGIAYQSGGRADGLATAQALAGIVGAVPFQPTTRIAVGARCTNTAQAKSASYLARELAATGSIASVFGTGPDLTTTGWAVLALVGAGEGRAAIARGTRSLKAGAPAETTDGTGPVPGDLGLFLMVAKATGSNPKDFGGVNLVSTLAGSIQK